MLNFKWQYFEKGIILLNIRNCLACNSCERTSLSATVLKQPIGQTLEGSSEQVSIVNGVTFSGTDVSKVS